MESRLSISVRMKLLYMYHFLGSFNTHLPNVNY